MKNLGVKGYISLPYLTGLGGIYMGRILKRRPGWIYIPRMTIPRGRCTIFRKFRIIRGRSGCQWPIIV
jgi:hypothetical protein